MSKTMTKEQEQAVDKYAVEILRNGIKCGVKTDMKVAADGIARLYQKYLDLQPPKECVLVKSPEEAITKSGADRSKIREIIWIAYWTSWVAYYHAGVHILGETEGVEKDLIDDLDWYEGFCKQVYAILPFENVCYVIEWPKKCCIKDDDLEKFQLHRDGGLALEFQDGTGFAWLNGIEVPDYVAKTAPAKLSIKKLMAEQNTDVRREGFKRMGIINVLKKLKAKVLDRRKASKSKPWNDYELLEANFGDKVRRFLKMRNPSTKDFVIEQVAPECKSIDEANAMQCRETKHVEPISLT